jgi:hypothetical protein
MYAGESIIAHTLNVGLIALVPTPPQKFTYDFLCDLTSTFLHTLLLVGGPKLLPGLTMITIEPHRSGIYFYGSMVII